MEVWSASLQLPPNGPEEKFIKNSNIYKKILSVQHMAVLYHPAAER